MNSDPGVAFFSFCFPLRTLFRFGKAKVVVCVVMSSKKLKLFLGIDSQRFTRNSLMVSVLLWISAPCLLIWECKGSQTKTLCQDHN